MPDGIEDHVEFNELNTAFQEVDRAVGNFNILMNKLNHEARKVMWERLRTEGASTDFAITVGQDQPYDYGVKVMLRFDLAERYLLALAEVVYKE